MILELFTMIRFLFYPVMLVGGATWALFMMRSYRKGRRAEMAWSAWLGAAVAVLGVAGFVSLLVSNSQGFGTASSVVFSLGPMAVTLVTAAGAAAMWLQSWRDQ